MTNALSHALADTVVVLDFETTGLSPQYGDRAIEIGAVKIVGGTIVERFQKLMNPGFAISGFIAEYTGITNSMLRDAAPCREVMSEFHEFLGNHNLVAHNATFDQKFLDSEFSKISRSYSGKFSCSMLLSRRLIQDAQNHKLETLVRHLNIASEGTFHRAQYDAEMAGKVWLAMLERISVQAGLLEVPFDLADKLCKASKAKANALLRSYVVSTESPKA
ncbi:MAG: 3'-5' exoribonuclease [Fibrobacteres bacterium]|jgi:DNA polymerase-3 subunit epsilon|nr:3'-5' exoribonuclease [Fibrobacterota bacterium]